MRENVHDVRGPGPGGARLLDFFAFCDSGGRSVSLSVSDLPKDPAKLIFEATWSE